MSDKAFAAFLLILVQHNQLDRARHLLNWFTKHGGNAT